MKGLRRTKSVFKASMNEASRQFSLRRPIFPFQKLRQSSGFVHIVPRSFTLGYAATPAQPHGPG